MSGLQFNGVNAPADGMYDVTWWYHCAKNDNFGDKNCGGQTTPATTAAGCRPHNIDVNGMRVTGTFHFPCYGDASWTVIHATTTPLALKSGANTIKIYPTPPRDSADLDAIVVYPAGEGLPPSLMPQMDPIGH
jgi:hypothetical protein